MGISTREDNTLTPEQAAIIIATKGNVSDNAGVLLSNRPTTAKLSEVYRAMAIRGVPPSEARLAVETIANHHNVVSPWS